jgi:hypothetical protein
MIEFFNTLKNESENKDLFNVDHFYFMEDENVKSIALPLRNEEYMQIRSSKYKGIGQGLCGGNKSVFEDKRNGFIKVLL